MANGCDCGLMTTNTTDGRVWIYGPVGAGGLNRPCDVKLVQELLTKNGFPLVADTKCGPLTIQAIRRFQVECVKLQEPDGLIEPGKRSWGVLINTRHPRRTSPSVNASQTATALTPAVAQQSSASSSTGVEKLLDVLDYIDGYGRAGQGGFSGFSNLSTLIQRARACNPSVPFLSTTKAKTQSIDYCAAYVKMGLLGANYASTYSQLNCQYARDMGPVLASLGFSNVVEQLFGSKTEIRFANIPNGAIIVYKQTEGGGSYAGHIEVFNSATQRFLSDFITDRPASTPRDRAESGYLQREGGRSDRLRKYKVIGIWTR